MVQVSLVQMPYSAVVRPSISLGLLRSYLREHAIEAKVVYANLAFAERIGIEVYRLIENTPANSLIGEWTFAASAFRTPAKGSRDFLRKVGAGFADPYANFIRHRYTLADVEGVIEDVRESADRFVDDVADQVLATRPRIVGCTSMFQQHCASLALLRRIKELAPDVTTMLGGANCEGPMGEQAHRSFPWVDFVASGEADEYFGALCRHILDEGRTIPIEALPEGVWAPAHRAPRDTAPPTPAGKVGVSLDRRPLETPAARSIVNDLDRLAVPDFDDYFEALEHSYLGRYIDPALPLETSRGCWWGQKHHCTFCGLNGAGMTYRKKSPERAQREIEALTERYGIYNLSPTDNILEMSYLTSLLPALAESGPRYALFYEVKPNLRRPQLETLAAAGARWLQPGIESLHDEVLKLLDKGVSALNNVQLLKWGLELGIRLEYYILYGAPGGARRMACRGGGVAAPDRASPAAQLHGPDPLRPLQPVLHPAGDLRHPPRALPHVRRGLSARRPRDRQPRVLLRGLLRRDTGPRGAGARWTPPARAPGAGVAAALLRKGRRTPGADRRGPGRRPARHRYAARGDRAVHGRDRRAPRRARRV